MMGRLKSIGGGSYQANSAIRAVDACIDQMHEAARALERCGPEMEKFAEAFRVDANNLTKRRNLLRDKLGAR